MTQIALNESMERTTADRFPFVSFRHSGIVGLGESAAVAYGNGRYVVLGSDNRTLGIRGQDAGFCVSVTTVVLDAMLSRRLIAKRP